MNVIPCKLHMSQQHVGNTERKSTVRVRGYTYIHTPMTNTYIEGHMFFNIISIFMS